MNNFWKSAAFIFLNLVFIVWLGILAEMFIRVLRGDDPLALLGILIADIVFLVLWILLMLLNRYYHVPVLNRVLPVIAIVVLTVVAVLNVSTATLWLGLVTTVLVALVSLIITIITVATTR